ncbi:phage tail domain-containing protein [Mammaliicoccus sp. JADD-157]|uniref:phage tail domain-containing protein n=1 Tax=Mammaliicoccus sp. JADD-157 TaxID=3404818 RepID=UPI003BB55169
MDVEIVKKDGSVYRLSDFGVVYDFVVGSISIEQYSDRVEGRFGKVDYGADYTSRRIKVPMKFKHNEMHHYAHLRDDLYGVLTDVESYYIREMRRPKRLEYEFVDFGETPRFLPNTDNQYVNGKQYLVRMVGELEPEQLFNGGEIEIEFETTELPFAETIYTTLEVDETGYIESINKYGLADNLNQDLVKYRHNSLTFDVWNGGNVTVIPESMFLKIDVVGLVTSGNFVIQNDSTGDKFMYNDSVSSRTLTLDGMQVKVDQTNKLRSCNREFISLKPGLNRITVKNGTYQEIKVDFKKYYK